MRRLETVICAAIFLVAGGGYAGAQSPQPKEPPFVLTSGPDGQFSVKMPGLPEFSSSQLPLGKLAPPRSVQLNTFVVSLDDGAVAYEVAYDDYPADVDTGDPAAVLMDARDGAATGKKLLSDSAITLGGVPGRAFTIGAAGGIVIDERVYLAGKRLYQLVVVTTKGYTAPGRDEFMNSFTLK